ncbi:MAG TPA: hypothetical protein DCS43_07340 [Verrucomicrobia bacterium]|nr:hypothetical protein [Verrucomicrobiota bacterium]
MENRGIRWLRDLEGQRFGQFPIQPLPFKAEGQPARCQHVAKDPLGVNVNVIQQIRPHFLDQPVAAGEQLVVGDSPLAQCLQCTPEDTRGLPWVWHHIDQEPHQCGEVQRGAIPRRGFAKRPLRVKPQLIDIHGDADMPHGGSIVRRKCGGLCPFQRVPRHMRI